MKLFSADNFIEEAVNEYSDTIYRIALNITHNEQDSFDVCQEVFIRLIKNTDKIKDKEHLKAWLIRVAVNCSKDLMKKACRNRDISLSEAENLEFNQNYRDLTLLQSVGKLSEKYSTVIYLHYYEDMKTDEISKVLKISRSAVKQRLARGREKLKIILEREHYNDI